MHGLQYLCETVLSAGTAMKFTQNKTKQCSWYARLNLLCRNTLFQHVQLLTHYTLLYSRGSKSKLNTRNTFVERDIFPIAKSTITEVFL